LYNVDETPLLAENYPQDAAAEATYLAEGADNKVNKYSYLWPYSGTLSMMSALYEATKDDEILEFIDQQVLEGLKMYYDTTREPHGYSSYITVDKSDRFYDDNIWLVIDLVDLYTLTSKQSYLDMALDAWNFVLSGRDTVLGDGIYWCEQNKNTKNTCSNAPAAVAALKLYKATGYQQYFDQGENFYTWVFYSLQDKDHLYFDNVSIKGKFDKRKFSYNSGQMIEAGALLYEITGNEEYLLQAQATAAASLHQWTKVYSNEKEESLYIVESGDVWFDAVLLRGYLALWRVDGQDAYISSFDDTLSYAWYVGRDENGLFGKYLTHRQEGETKSWLLTQAAYVEMAARLAAADWQNTKE
jgi:predicted alpha-1,6-mannanase (GH76 family)